MPKPSGGKRTLSSLISGLRLALSDPMDQFHEGIGIIARIAAERIDPSELDPIPKEWRSYIELRERTWSELTAETHRIETFLTAGGLPGMYLKSSLPGVHGLLRSRGARVSIARGLQGGSRTITIASDIGLGRVLAELARREPGWGGPGTLTIIGSPLDGTKLPFQTVLEIATNCL
jgi:hypothetical protein